MGVLHILILVVQGENNERKTFNNTSELKAWVNQYGVTPVNFKCDNKFTILGSGGSSSNSDDRTMRDLSRAMSQILDKLKVIERGQGYIKSKVDNIQLPQLPQQNDVPATQQDVTALLQILADLDTKMDTVLQEQQSSKVEMTHGFDAVKQKLAEVGVYNQFTLTDVKTDELLASTSDTDAYSIDIRLFVVNCKGCLIKRGMNDIRKKGTSFFSNKQAIKNKPYKVYVDKSLAVLPIEHDERLFNFYVNFYLKPYARIDAKETKNYHAYNYSQTGLDSNKSYFDLFINAYFAAKKSLLHVGVNFLKIIDDMEYNLVTQEDILLYAQFLLRIKMCLMIQGMRAEKAEWMLHKFMHYDGTLSIYQGKMVQMRSTVQNGYEVK